METKLNWYSDYKPSMHGSYLQGMETTAFLSTFTFPAGMHGSYLQGMETHQDARKRNAPLLARILPTRNGNGKKVSGILRMIGGTDPTYKEWKLLGCLHLVDSVCARILPTRNGNYLSNPL